MAGLEDLIEAWRRSPALHDLTEGASEAVIADAAARLGRPLPGQLVSILQLSNGCSLLEGNLGITPVGGADDMFGMADRLRGSGWRIPNDLLPVGTNGAGLIVALWYPPERASTDDSPVVLIGDPDVEGYMSFAGSSLPRFLRSWTAYYLVLLEAPGPALDAIGVPQDLRSGRLDDMRPYVAWGDPALDDPEVDPFVARLTSRAVAALATPRS